MTYKFEKKYIHALIVVVVLSLSSCNRDVKPRHLDGKWNLEKLDGEIPDDPITFEFEEDGDFTYCYDGDCTTGEWKWEEKGEELEIDLSFGGDSYITTFDVDKLDKEVLEGDWIFNGYLISLEFERD